MFWLVMKVIGLVILCIIFTIFSFVLFEKGFYDLRIKKSYGAALSIVAFATSWIYWWWIWNWWGSLIVTGIVALICLVGASIEETPEQTAERIKQEEEARKEQEKKREEFLQGITNFFEANGNVLLDSNIWMNTSAAIDKLFGQILLKRLSRTKAILLLSSQLDEMEKIKNTPKTGETAHSARVALRRIEKLQKEGIVVVKTNQVFNRTPGYADPNIEDFVKAMCQSRTPCAVLTEDRALRIRLRAILDENQGSDIITVQDMEELQIFKLKKLNF